MLLNVFIPFFNFLLISLFGRYLGRIGVMWLTIYSYCLCIFFNISLFVQLLKSNSYIIVDLGSWINIEFLSIKWEFIFDNISISMLVMVSLISFLVHMYSFSYMKNDPHFNRFISYLSLFTFFMFILVTGGNFIQLFLGWEGVGICSYLLINFWFTRLQANKAALKALIMNRIGDIGFLLGTVFTFYVFKTIDFLTLQTISHFLNIHVLFFNYLNYVTISYIDIICIFFIIGVMGKSAQLGLHTWLPAAMEGPTPVSALIHAATMVTAGVFLLIRISFLFEISQLAQSLIILIGALTAFFSALTAVFLYDIKKIIAYSTCSQLGYMVVACGLSQYTLSLFHLINHAFFKALLFLTAGAIIHSFNNEQDIRKLNGLFFQAPFLYSCILIGNIAIMGIPFLSGYYSKDLIIELSFLKSNYMYVFFDININLIFIIIIAATLCTALYSFRLYYFLFLRQGTVHETSVHFYQQPFFIQFVLCCLLLGSIFSGYLLQDIFSMTSDFFIFTLSQWNSIELECLPWIIKLLPLFLNILTVIIGCLFIYNYNNNKIPSLMRILLPIVYKNKTNFFNLYKYKNFFMIFVKLCQNNFYFNELYNFIALATFNKIYVSMFLNLDKGILELFGPTGLHQTYLKITKYFNFFYYFGLIEHLFLIFNTILFLLLFIEYLY